MTATTNRERLQRHMQSAKTLIGDPVRNAGGDDLGEIEDLMLDLDFNRIAYAVLSFGGFLGMGDKFFAVPMESLAWDPVNQQFILDVDRQKLKDAPGFDKDDWPDAADRDWGESIHAHYGQEPYWSQ